MDYMQTLGSQKPVQDKPEGLYEGPPALSGFIRRHTLLRNTIDLIGTVGYYGVYPNRADFLRKINEYDQQTKKYNEVAQVFALAKRDASAGGKVSIWHATEDLPKAERPRELVCFTKESALDGYDKFVVTFRSASWMQFDPSGLMMRAPSMFKELQQTRGELSKRFSGQVKVGENLFNIQLE